jgi:hypothetical protein
LRTREWWSRKVIRELLCRSIELDS